MDLYDQDKKAAIEGVRLSYLEAKGLLNLLERADYSYSPPCFLKFAAEMAERLRKEGIR